jgi:hypothetical protein
MHQASDVYRGIKEGGAPQVCRSCIEHMMKPCDWEWNDEEHTSIRAFYICPGCGTPAVVRHWSVEFILNGF